MTDEVQRCVTLCYTKEWNPHFSKEPQFEECDSYLKSRTDVDAHGDELEIFLRDLEEPSPSTLVEEVQEFYKGTTIPNLESEVENKSQRRGAWLNDWSCRHFTSSEGVRKYENPLTAAALYRHLDKPRFDDPDLPNADRRLIYITNLDSAYILALFKTASSRQVSVLRHAIWKHIAFQTSIRVKIPYKGFPAFQLELHLPYFALRFSDSQEGMNDKRQSPWMDLSFLQAKTSTSKYNKVYNIYRAQISLVIAGYHDRRWVAYVFQNNTFDNEDLDDEVYRCYEGFQEDPVASNGLVDANNPIWSPREYFALMFEYRLAGVLAQWQNLVRWVERSIQGDRNQHPFPLSEKFGRTKGDRPEDVKETYDWTQKTRALLNQLISLLSELINEWEAFKSSDGDILYFSDLKDVQSTAQACSYPPLRSIKDTLEKIFKATIEDIPTSQDHTHRSLRSIKEMFETLYILRQKLVALRNSSENSAKDLKLRLILQSNEAARQATEAALLGNEAAQRSSLMTELTVTIITPFALATAYFSMPPAAVPFTMNTKSFTISFFVFMAAVKLLVMILGTLSHWWRERHAASRKGPSYVMSLHHLSTIGKIGWVLVRRGQRKLARDIEEWA